MALVGVCAAMGGASTMPREVVVSHATLSVSPASAVVESPLRPSLLVALPIDEDVPGTEDEVVTVGYEIVTVALDEIQAFWDAHPSLDRQIGKVEVVHI
jgi:hypothetical protein